ncbi:RcnB family protein [Variovorax terrae]|uniref:RcnB family protein n=1 Tax=Variovorax terrae TaxID=2923278 RepID=A0A9X1VS91_9BURK|nr:RcnB family protein [Variovorax terrae]MCJ0762430.1 RcnB family protein [Variovorax terrae]
MKRNKILVSALAMILLASSGWAAAQGRDDRGERGDRGDRGDRQGMERQQSRQPMTGFERAANEANARGAGPDHNFRRGQRLPPEFRGRQSVVDDWRGHHLSPPPRGYQWVQTGADYVLVAVATGIIAQILLGQ